MSPTPIFTYGISLIPRLIRPGNETTTGYSRFTYSILPSYFKLNVVFHQFIKTVRFLPLGQMYYCTGPILMKRKANFIRINIHVTLLFFTRHFSSRVGISCLELAFFNQNLKWYLSEKCRCMNFL